MACFSPCSPRSSGTDFPIVKITNTMSLVVARERSSLTCICTSGIHKCEMQFKYESIMANFVVLDEQIKHTFSNEHFVGLRQDKHNCRLLCAKIFVRRINHSHSPHTVDQLLICAARTTGTFYGLKRCAKFIPPSHTGLVGIQTG